MRIIINNKRQSLIRLLEEYSMTITISLYIYYIRGGGSSIPAIKQAPNRKPAPEQPRLMPDRWKKVVE